MPYYYVISMEYISSMLTDISYVETVSECMEQKASLIIELCHVTFMTAIFIFLSFVLLRILIDLPFFPDCIFRSFVTKDKNAGKKIIPRLESQDSGGHARSRLSS